MSGSRGLTRQLPMMTRQQSAPEPETAPIQTTSNILDDTDNHSSEEELEDIIGDKKVYGGTAVTGAGVSIKSGGVGARCSSTNPEKRKWSEVNSSGDETERSTSQCVFRAGSGSSGDEEVSGLMDGAGASYTPVQFCTSPPLDVYKPRKSQSPPPKLFHMSSNGHGHTGPLRQHSFDSAKTRGEQQRPSGAFLPRPRPRLMRPVEFSSLSGPGSAAGRHDTGQADNEGQEEADNDNSGHRSPSKRHRTTPIQRPCLDFEKMQQVTKRIAPSRYLTEIPLYFQIKTKVVTSWRSGTELSLFCW